MGQKVHPYSYRLGYIKDWKSSWFANQKRYADYAIEDIKVRKFIAKELKAANVASIEVERTSNMTTVHVHCAKPGVVLGKSSTLLSETKRKLSVKLQTRNVEIRIKEVKRPDLDATVVAESISQALERRVSYRRAMKQASQRAIEAGAKGVKIYIGGRLNGSDIARWEYVSEGRIPRQTLRSDIDYALASANTTYGVLGIKVWIYRGDVFQQKGNK